MVSAIWEEDAAEFFAAAGMILKTAPLENLSNKSRYSIDFYVYTNRRIYRQAL